MENRNRLIVDVRLTEANGAAERATALAMIEDNAKPGSTVRGERTMTQRSSSPAAVIAATRRTYRGTTLIALGHRCSHYPTSRLSHLHDQTQANRRTIRLDEDHRRTAQRPVIAAALW
jgi:hypothetical protein